MAASRDARRRRGERRRPDPAGPAPRTTSALSPALARAALAATADGIVLLDKAGVMRGANPACAAAFGVAETALVGRRLGEFVEVAAADGGLAEALAAAG